MGFVSGHLVNVLFYLLFGERNPTAVQVQLLEVSNSILGSRISHPNDILEMLMDNVLCCLLIGVAYPWLCFSHWMWFLSIFAVTLR
jgi:hypothetical protein